MASNSPQDIIKFREDAISDIEFRQHELWESGEATKWLMSADPHARVIAQDVNGPLIEELAAASGFWDPECIDMFRFGAPVVGKLPLSGSGPPCAVTEPVPVEDLREKCGERNRALLSTLREDPHADFLMSQIKKDAALGRMTEPVSITQVDLDKVVLARRFSVEQGTKADGSPKLRAVDDESANGTNSCCAQTEKPACDSMDAFVRSIVRFSRKTGVAPAFWKADIDAAYRRIPVMPEHRWLLWIVILIGGDLFAAMHTALCFGCIGSVLGWNRIGALIAHVARVVLKLPVNRYVDDLFGVDWPQCTVHAMQCFARLVRAMLGFTAIAAAKLNAGAPLDVLGLMISASPSSVFVQLTREKAVKWSARIMAARSRGTLHAGEASKFAGRLSFAAQHMFFRLGRAMLQPIFQQQYAPLSGGRIGPLLDLALRWWLVVLQSDLCEEVRVNEQPCTVDMFCDARGTPARIAAVVFSQGQIVYSDWEPPSELLNTFQNRNDEQIMGKELLAIVLGLCTFTPLLKDKCVRIWTDNAGGEGALKKGRAKANDHNLLVHATWLFAAQNNIGVQIERVPTDDNISDEPSREKYDLMNAIGAKWHAPVIADNFWHPTKWESIAL